MRRSLLLLERHVRCVVAAAVVSACGDGPVASDPILEPLVTINAGVLHTCGTTASGGAFCWGWNRYGQIGDGSRSNRVLPVRVDSPPAAGGPVVVGGGHSCVLTSAGAAYCWGLNLSGQLGAGGGGDRVRPTPVAGGLTFIAIATGGAFTCGVAADSTAHCWGWNAAGQLGDGTLTDRAAPTTVLGGLKVVSIAAATRHACALVADSSAYCWGANGRGALGDGTDADTTRPSAVAGGHRFVTITLGVFHSCALTGAGAVYCWGDNGYGQLGDTAASSTSSVPHLVPGGLVFTGLAAGGIHTCGIAQGGAAHCWGSDLAGALGGQATDTCAPDAVSVPCARLPVPVDGGLTFASIAAGLHHTCGITTGGVAYCWGENDRGQLGDGTTRFRVAPALVANQEGVP
jgi:alpha-tubulin suppressor-like RCC1 family protein